MVYVEQVLQPYFATPAGCLLRQRYPCHPIPYQHNQGWEEQGFCNKEGVIIQQQKLDPTPKT